MLRVVIDTNIVISALNFGGNPKAVLELARKNRIHNIISPFIINEVEKVLTQKFGWQMEVTREVLNDFQNFSQVVNPSETIAVISIPLITASWNAPWPAGPIASFPGTITLRTSRRTTRLKLSLPRSF